MARDALPNDWRLTTLPELGEVNRGRSRHRPRHAPHLYGGPYPFVQTGDIKASGGRITNYTQTYSEAGLAQSRLWPAGTMCITIAATIAETGILQFPACFPDSVVGFIPDLKKCDAYFVEFMFRYLRDGIQFRASGSVQDNINLQTIRELRFPLPPLDEQRAIARVLGALDDKIELNRRMNRTLEDLAITLFRSWFVDFDPVVAKAAGRKPAHLRPELASFFAAHFQGSELGPIPQGWRVGRVSELASLTRGGINPGEFPTETFDHYSIPAFDDGRLPRQELGSTIKSNKFPVPPGCVMISKLNPDTPRIWWPEVASERRAVCSTEFLVSTPIPPCTREFLFSLYLSEAFTSAFATLVTGTSGSHQRVKPDGLLTTEVVIPDEPVMSEFTRLVRPWLEQVTHNIRESRTLAALRNTLLPKLLCGELRVKQAEKLVAAAS